MRLYMIVFNEKLNELLFEKELKPTRIRYHQVDERYESKLEIFFCISEVKYLFL